MSLPNTNIMVNANTKYEFTTQEVEWFSDWILQRMGISYPPNKHVILQKRLESLAIRLDIPDVRGLREAIETRSVADIYTQMADTVTTNHTHFFREIDTLNFFSDQIIDSIKGENVRIWSAASSSGEELYTLALILIQKYGFATTRSRFSLLGTDISNRVITEAERAIYPVRRIDDVPKEMVRQWFKQVGLNGWELKNEVKDLCIYRRLNLMSNPWPFSNLFNVIFLRNVLYYFDRAGQRALLLKMYDCVEPGGWLLTSVTETLSELDVPWTRVCSGVYRKQVH